MSNIVWDYFACPLFESVCDFAEFSSVGIVFIALLQSKAMPPQWSNGQVMTNTEYSFILLGTATFEPNPYEVAPSRARGAAEHDVHRAAAIRHAQDKGRVGGEASEALPSGGSANGVVAFWSDKRFMRVAQDHRRDFRPIVEQSLWVAGTFVRVPDDREGGEYLALRRWCHLPW